MSSGPSVSVFVSSTSEDLKKHREAARDAVLAAGMVPAMMEYFAASGERRPLAACLSKVSEADILLVLVAHRYGWVPPDQAADQHRSITWLECERAVAEGKEVLALVVDDKHPWPEEAREAYRLTAAMQNGSADEALFREVNRHVALLKEFKAWLNALGIRVTFTTPEDLRSRVGEALHDWRRRHPDREPGPAPIPRPADPKAYLRNLQEKTAYIDIRGLQVGKGRASRFPIEELFISLTTTQAPATGEDALRRSRAQGDAEQRMPESHTILLQEALQHDRLVVVGDPGSGKTTFLRRVAQALCQTQLGDDPHAAGERLGIAGRTFPILIRISDLAEHLSRQVREANAPAGDDAPAWLPHYLAAASAAQNSNLDAAFFHQQLAAGRCTVLLDGLDEAPDRRGRERLSRLIENVTRAYAGCRFVVTSRPAAYTGGVALPDFAHARIDPLSDDAVATFLSRWCGAIYADSPQSARAHCQELLDAVRARTEIGRMARNPVMLTALGVVHWNERRLPEQRADLYTSIVTWLSRSREQRPGRATAEGTVVLLQELALAMQDPTLHAPAAPAGEPDDSPARLIQVPKRWAAERIAAEMGGGAVTKETVEQAERFLDEEEVDSGIIVGRGNELAFWHLTFQEFLAAKAVASRLEEEQRRILFADPGKLYRPEWREVVLLLSGTLHQQGRAKVDGLVRGFLEGLGPSAALADQARCAGLLGAVLRDLAPLHYEVSDVRYQSLLDGVMAIFDPQGSQTVPLEQRIAAADALGQAGDPRIDFERPDYWATIPAGKFLMGAQSKDPHGPNYDPESTYEDEWRETPHEVYLDAYRIARYPVTVGQYRRFVEDEGYDQQRWWTAGGFGQFSEPDNWESQLAYPSRPVVGVSWWESAAFCAWARLRLPTEAEWERAARGTAGRKFPWGSDPIDETRANYRHQPGHPTPVGIYPLGNTPEKICDLAGNVWEWCEDGFGVYTSEAQSNPHGVSGAARRVGRGGGWARGAGDCRSAVRRADEPDYRYGSLGFRVAAVPLGPVSRAVPSSSPLVRAEPGA